MRLIRNRGILLLIFLALLFAAIWVAQPPEKKLLEKATRYSNLIELLVHSEDYVWASTNQIFTIRDDPEGRHVAVYVDPATGKEKLLTALNPLPGEPGSPGDVFHWRLSPDSRWLLVAQGIARQVNLVATLVDGTRKSSWTAPWKNQTFLWLPDSRRFTEIVPGTNQIQIRVHDIASPAVEENCRQLPDALTVCGVFDDQSAIAVHYSWNMLLERDLFFFDLSGSNKSPRKISVPMPARSYCHGVHLSPDGKRLLWNLVFTRIAGVKLRPQYPFFGVKTVTRNGLWLSRADGTGLHEIGHLPPSSSLNQSQWLPDNRHVSFNHDAAVWVVPVD